LAWQEAPNLKHLIRSKKGQFSIIAALLVAVVIISTVITTYSAIRYDPIEAQPQILSAVDETNLALKQLLGFTVGYYGSILQVTGNTSYAQNLARNYMQSGLENIMDIKPDWGLSFNVNFVDLHIDWFEPTSTSSGQFNVTYDLTGLGFYNLTYVKQSSLSVEILDSLSSNEARVSVLEEGTEPLISLSRNNFKFYRYATSEQSWQLVTPSVEPTVSSNGTYALNVPSGVDAESYMVQVEDARGIVTVASSFSRYVSTLNWNNALGDGDYVDTDSDLYAPTNKGSHSNFAAQQNGPDSIYDTLTEEYTSGTASNSTLISAESFETYPPSGWSETPSGNYWTRKSDQHYSGSYSAGYDGGQESYGALSTPNLDLSGATAIYVDFWYRDAGFEGNELLLQYYDGSNWDTIADLGTSTENQWNHYQQRVTDSQYFKSNFKLRFYADTNYNNDDAWIDAVTVKKETDNSNYELDLEEQWTNVSLANPNQELCIKTGSLGSEPLKVDVWSGGTWVNIINALNPNAWNNITISPYLSSNFTIRFRGGIETSDAVQDSWAIDAVLLRPQSDLGSLLTGQDSTITVEWLQNGTMRWLGQNLQLTTTEKPIPPISAKAFHLTQTVSGVDQEVPFQIEDWASEFRVPLGMTNNATVISNRQMLVFLLNRDVSKFTLWWDGSDLAVQTLLAYENTYFNDNPSSRTLNNGMISLQFGSNFNPVTSTVLSSGNTSTATFMRINGEDSAYGAELAYVITNGVVRDVIQQEAEWGGGAGTANDSPNLYSNMVLTLPAGTSYYTYQLRLMFIDSQRDRTITDISPVRLTSSISTLQTENGTVNNVATGTGNFNNYAFGSGGWTAHHWSQFISGSSGAGIMFTNDDNIRLYAFDSVAGNPTGAVRTNSGTRTIELAPVSLFQVTPFRNALDITWHGAIVTFDSSATPIYYLNAGKPAGLWILVEYQPEITLTAET